MLRTLWCGQRLTVYIHLATESFRVDGMPPLRESVLGETRRIFPRIWVAARRMRLRGPAIFIYAGSKDIAPMPD